MLPTTTLMAYSMSKTITAAAVPRRTRCVSAEGCCKRIRSTWTPGRSSRIWPSVVLVRGDQRSSTVRVTVSWPNPAANFGCVTTGVWEADTEEAIRERAEG